MYSKHKSGAIAELKVAQYYLEHDYEIFLPTTSSVVDLIAMKGKELVRVQVKSAYFMGRPSGASYIQVTTRRNSSTYGRKLYEEEDYDVLAVAYKQRLWLFPIKDVMHLQSIILDKGQQTRRSSSVNFNSEPYECH